MVHPIGCYVHIPFCVRKCAYCDFNSYSGYTDAHIIRYIAALKKEIRRCGSEPQSQETPVDTIFFGGGTPTAIPANDEAELLRTVLDLFPVISGAEITTEANPGTMDTAHLEILRGAGFNRISFGVQSFDPGLLKTMDRIHSADEARAAVVAARTAGFTNISLDLMFGLPRQTIQQWRDTLDQAFELEIDHISLYSLIVEEGTGFWTLQKKGRLPLPDDDLTAEMFQMAIDSAQAAGMHQYEISNFARPDRMCRHNIHYWRNEPYYGFGCGAVSYIDGVRGMNIKSPGKYAEAVESHSVHHESQEILTLEETLAEIMMLGLRLTEEGIDCSQIATRTGIDPRNRFKTEIARFVNRGLLEHIDERVRLTPRGVFLASEVMMEFI